MATLLNQLILISEKAANIARICRQEETLFQLLIEEKSPDEANTRFVKDFKTLADVLIQETLRHFITKECPSLGIYVQGEENNSFTNVSGENVTVIIGESSTETANTLKKVLEGNTEAGDILAAEVHRVIDVTDVNIHNSRLPEEFELNTDNLGIWIDPIDSTAEYIKGAIMEENEDGICVGGLRSVTVLIGVYDRESGVPLLGVINQPFHSFENSKWTGKCYWGSCVDGAKQSCVDVIPTLTKITVMSKVERYCLREIISSSGYKIIDAAGAGYKLLMVILGRADMYILSQATTFSWDVCGPHACLLSIGGDLFQYNQMLVTEKVPINYFQKKPRELSPKSRIKPHCNKHGLVAIRNDEILEDALIVLKDEI